MPFFPSAPVAADLVAMLLVAMLSLCSDEERQTRAAILMSCHCLRFTLSEPDPFGSTLSLFRPLFLWLLWLGLACLCACVYPLLSYQ